MTSQERAQSFYADILRPGLEDVEKALSIPFSQSAARFLLAIGLQESGLMHRYQLVGGTRAGPARGWWQFERGGGVRGVMRHRSSKLKAADWCERCRVQFSEYPIHRALEGHDWLAVGFARLLVCTSPNALPSTQKQGWTQYRKELWRPGKPHIAAWPTNWLIASEIVYGVALPNGDL